MLADENGISEQIFQKIASAPRDSRTFPTRQVDLPTGDLSTLPGETPMPCKPGSLNYTVSSRPSSVLPKHLIGPRH